MKKIVLIIVVLSTFSYFAFPLFWGASRDSLTPQFIYDEFIEMSAMDPFEFFAEKVIVPVFNYLDTIFDQLWVYVKRFLGLLIS